MRMKNVLAYAALALVALVIAYVAFNRIVFG